MTVFLAENTWPCGFSLLHRLFCLDWILFFFGGNSGLPSGFPSAREQIPPGSFFVFAERSAAKEGSKARHDFARLRLRFFLLYLTYDTNYKKRKYFLSRGSANRS